jgi:AhpD family alkylhydroperoxidase
MPGGAALRCSNVRSDWRVADEGKRNIEENVMFDMKNLGRLKTLDKNAPDAMKAFWAFDKSAFAEGALTVQQKQLMAVAVALTTQCPYCIELHTKAAREAGASDAQLSEAALVAAAIRAGGAITHATHLFRE